MAKMPIVFKKLSSRLFHDLKNKNSRVIKLSTVTKTITTANGPKR